MFESDSKYAFSLIVGTAGRTAELIRLLDSLVSQEFKSFELIIVDQNVDDTAKKIVSEYTTEIDIKLIKSARGLSRARNAGLRVASGRIITFSDDDCWYHPALLKNINEVFARNDAPEILTIKMCCDGNYSAPMQSDADIMLLNKYNFHMHHISICIFFSASACKKAGLFNERLGVGANTIFGAGEETDYLIRAMRSGFACGYIDSIYIYHPDVIAGRSSDAYCRRCRCYGTGRGAVVRRYYPFPYVLLFCFWPLVKVFKSLCLLRTNELRPLLNDFIGRVEGILNYRKAYPE